MTACMEIVSIYIYMPWGGGQQFGFFVRGLVLLLFLGGVEAFDGVLCA